MRTILGVILVMAWTLVILREFYHTYQDDVMMRRVHRQMVLIEIDCSYCDGEDASPDLFPS
jgi:hypothetical protein